MCNTSNLNSRAISLAHYFSNLLWLIVNTWCPFCFSLEFIDQGTILLKAEYIADLINAVKHHSVVNIYWSVVKQIAGSVCVSLNLI